jgi:uncharacterized membrane protein
MRHDRTGNAARATANEARDGSRCWVIRRNCSASPRQLAAAYGGIVAVAAAIGAGFAACGLWLVLPFVGLESLAVGVAFLLFARHATDFERIELACGTLVVERHDGGRCQRWQFVAAWTRVDLERQAWGPMRRPRVLLVSKGERVEVGRHALESYRTQLARELRGALRSVTAVQ